MAITETGAASTGGTGTNASITHGLTINSGDVIIVTLHANNNPTRTDNNGANSFTDDFADQGANASHSYTIFSRVAGASEPASYSFTLGSSERWSIVIRVFEGVHPTIYDVAPAAGNKYVRNTDPSPAVDAITTTYDRSYAFFLVISDNETNTYTGPTNGYGDSVARTSNQVQDTYIKFIATAGSTGTAEVVSANNTDHALQHFALREASGLAITLEPTETRTTVQTSFTVSNPATVPTTLNTTIALEAGGPSVAPDSVTGIDPYTIYYTFPESTNKKYSNTGYVHRITIGAETVDSTPIVYLPKISWNFENVGTPDTSAAVYNSYTGGTFVSTDQVAWGTISDPSGNDVTIYDTLNWSINPVPTQNQTIGMFRIAADGTKDINNVLTFEVSMAASAWVEHDDFKTALGNKEVDLDADTFEYRLYASTSNINDVTVGNATTATNEISGNGYGAKAATGTWTQSGSITTFTTTLPNFTASGGDIICRYAAIIDTTVTPDLVIAHCVLDDTPANVIISDGNTMTIQLPTGVTILS